MPRRELLSPAQRQSLLAIPTDRADLMEHYILSEQDLALIRQRRGANNRIGMAVQLAFLRFPGRALQPDETPPDELLSFLAAQLKADGMVWAQYAEREETRREHLRDLQLYLKLEPFTIGQYRSLSSWLMPVALQTDRGFALVTSAIDEIRRRCVVLPRLTVIERMCAAAAVRARRRIYELLTHDLRPDQRTRLDTLLLPYENGLLSTLAWLRSPPGAPNARHLLAHVERLKKIRTLELPPDLGQRVPHNRLLQLAREGAVTTTQHLGRMDEIQRYATLVANAIEASATLTDEILELHDRMIGKAFNDAKRKHQEAFQTCGKAINQKVCLYAAIGQALLAARREGSDPFAAIERIVSWEDFERSIIEAEVLAEPETFDFLGLVAESYSQLRRYTPTLLETFDFRAASAVAPVMAAIEALRAMNRSGSRDLPKDAPIDFVNSRWRPYVVTDRGLDRRFYELCALTELKNKLRSGDIWVPESRQFKDFDSYLLAPARYAALNDENELQLAVPGDVEHYITARLAQLTESLDEVDRLAGRGELPDAKIVSGELKIAPLIDAVPEEIHVLTRRAYALLPHVKITDLLLEVDAWTGFTQHFAHRRTGESPKNRTLLLTAVLADAINLGLSKMAEACPGITARELDWLASMHIYEETYSRALAELVNFHHRHPFSGHWGEGTTSSSDGQRFRAAGRGEQTGQVNLRYGSEPGVLFYTHISDQYSPFHTKVISANARDATHVLDGLLYHESELAIEEHYTDTAGYTDHVFALCHLLGFRFAPRIRDLGDTRLYVPDYDDRHLALASIIGGKLNLRLIRTQWREILRLAASIRHGTVTASLIIRKISSYPRQNSLAVALREVGRSERTIFMLEWMQNPELRRRVHVGLNKGEAKNALARAIFFNRQGELRDRTFEDQRFRASGLNLVVTAIILWNTVYLDRAVAALGEHGIAVDRKLLGHLSPVGWEHINLTGDYTWRTAQRVAQQRFRPLRPFGLATG